jgi:hypothetical protein
VKSLNFATPEINKQGGFFLINFELGKKRIMGGMLGMLN